MIQLAMNRLRRVSVVLTWHFFQRDANSTKLKQMTKDERLNP